MEERKEEGSEVPLLVLPKINITYTHRGGVLTREYNAHTWYQPTPCLAFATANIQMVPDHITHHMHMLREQTGQIRSLREGRHTPTPCHPAGPLPQSQSVAPAISEQHCRAARRGPLHKTPPARTAHSPTHRLAHRSPPPLAWRPTCVREAASEPWMPAAPCCGTRLFSPPSPGAQPAWGDSKCLVLPARHQAPGGGGGSVAEAATQNTQLSWSITKDVV